MTRVTTPSNRTGLAFAEEATIGVLPVTPDWIALEPNSYGAFGPDVETVARAPITADRQRRKGVVVGVTAGTDFETDLTDANLPLLMQGFLFADIRRKTELDASAATDTGYTVASGGTGFAAGDLLLASGAALAVNNGLKVVTASTGTSVSVAGNAAETAAIKLVKVGFQFSAGDAEIVQGVGVLPQLITTTKDLTAFGIIPGEFVYLGGDATANGFANAANQGWARVKSVTANAITFDKTDQAFVTDDGDGKTIRLFFGKVLKNESDPLLQKRRTYHFERTLGAPDSAAPSQIQAEYLRGGVPSTMGIAFSEAAIITLDIGIQALDGFTRTAVEGPLPGNRIAATQSDGYSANNDVKRIRMGAVPVGSSAPVPLFGFVQEAEIMIDNSLSENRAISYAGSIEMTEGLFMVSGDLTVYFANVASAEAVRANADITLDIAASKLNKGYAFDIPLVTLGGGRNNVEANEPITIELESMAASGAKYDANFDHTLLVTFFDYLPTAASLRVV
jgi:hypothetical protein